MKVKVDLKGNGGSEGASEGLLTDLGFWRLFDGGDGGFMGFVGDGGLMVVVESKFGGGARLRLRLLVMEGLRFGGEMETQCNI